MELSKTRFSKDLAGYRKKKESLCVFSERQRLTSKFSSPSSLTAQ